jgi:broad specificity phosphatase PhoE
MVRQYDTAAFVAAELGVPGDRIGIDDRLNEYDHVGVLSAHTTSVSFASTRTAEDRAALQSALDVALAGWMAGDHPGVTESHESFTTRVLAAAAQLTAQPGTTLAVTSGGVIAVIAARYLGLAESAWPRLAQVTVNTGITRLITGRSGTRVLNLNDFAHLEHDRALVTYR